MTIWNFYSQVTFDRGQAVFPPEREGAVIGEVEVAPLSITLRERQYLLISQSHPVRKKERPIPINTVASETEKGRLSVTA